MSVCPWAETPQGLLSFPPQLGGTRWLEGAGAGYSLPSGRLGSGRIVSPEGSLVKEHRYPDSSEWAAPHGSRRGFFFDPHSEHVVEPPRGKTHASAGPAWCLFSQTCPRWASSSSSMAGKVFPSRHCFPRLLTPVGCEPLYPLVCLQSARQRFALWPYFSDGSEKSCWFSACSAFSLLRWSEDFQAPYMQDWNLKGNSCFFILGNSSSCSLNTFLLYFFPPLLDS